MILNKKELFLLLLNIILIISISFLFNTINYNAGIILIILFSSELIFMNSTNVYSYIFLILPICTLFKFNENSITILPIIYIIFILKFILLEKKSIDKKQLLFFMILILLQLSSIIIENTPIANILSFLISYLFMFLLQNNNCSNEVDNNALFKKCSLYFIIGVFLSNFLAQVNHELPYIIDFEEQTALDTIGRFAGLNGDPNYYAQLCLIALSMIIYLFTSIKSYFKKFLLISAFLYISISAYKSYSKSYVLGLIFLLLCIIVILLVWLKRNKPNYFIVGLFALICVSIPSFILIFTKVAIPIFEMRETTQGGDILTGRGTIWKNYLGVIFDKPNILLIGCGYNNTQLLNNEAAHNMYIELFFNFGIIGVICFIVAFWPSIKNVFSSLFSINKLPILLLLFTGMALSLSTSDILFSLLPLYAVHKKGI